MKKIILTFSLLAILLGVACTTAKSVATAATPPTTTQNSEEKQANVKPMPTTDNRVLPNKVTMQQIKVSAPKQSMEPAPSKN